MGAATARASARSIASACSSRWLSAGLRPAGPLALHRRPLLQPADRRPIDAVGTGDQRLAFTGFYPGQGLPLLEGVELVRPAELHPVIDRPPATLGHPGRDQLPLE